MEGNQLHHCRSIRIFLEGQSGKMSLFKLKHVTPAADLCVTTLHTRQHAIIPEHTVLVRSNVRDHSGSLGGINDKRLMVFRTFTSFFLALPYAKYLLTRITQPKPQNSTVDGSGTSGSGVALSNWNDGPNIPGSKSSRKKSRAQSEG